MACPETLYPLRPPANLNPRQAHVLNLQADLIHSPQSQMLDVFNTIKESDVVLMRLGQLGTTASLLDPMM